MMRAGHESNAIAFDFDPLLRCPLFLAEGFRWDAGGAEPRPYGWDVSGKVGGNPYTVPVVADKIAI